MEFNLNNNNGYQWCSYNNLFVRGEVFLVSTGEVIPIEELSSHLGSLNSIHEISAWLENVDGNYSIILNKEDKVYLVADRLRTMPVFYSVTPDLVVADSTSNFSKISHPFNEACCEQFLATGYVIGNATMLTGVFQVEAGQVVSINKANQKVDSKDYFLYKPNVISNKNEEQLTAELLPLYTQTFSRLIKKLNGRTAVIPLSGGYDSRLVIHMLHNLNYKNIICFTYGEKGNWESKISQEVAEFYGYRWVFVEYKANELFELYQDIESFFDFSIAHSGFGHTQDLLAVKKLDEQGILPKDSVFIPGHSGDFVAGSHIPENYRQIDPVDTLFQKHCTLWPTSNPEVIKMNIRQQLEVINTERNTSNAEKIELWDWRERQAKYICNSIKVYEYFGYKWCLPLWEKSIMDFWLGVPVKHKINRGLYYVFANELHGEITANPKINFVKKVKNKYLDIWYGRFFPNNNFYLFKKLSSIFKSDELPKNISPDKSIIHINKVGLNTLKMWSCIRKKL